ncbi:MAG: hypothetical protein JW873_04935 [Candidatus Saganbacteria bacterium]|nr:hypothetical protein [Candidatus Saganbacteria bacterium]
MSDSLAGPVPAKVPVYRLVPAEQRKRKRGNEKERLGTASAMIKVYSHDVLAAAEEGRKTRLLCQITATVPSKTGRSADQVEEVFDLDHREAAPYIKASTTFPDTCSIYTLIIKRPADPRNINFLK